MSNHSARDLGSSPARPRLAAVEWAIPSTGPDTSAVDSSWFEDYGPRHSFIGFKGAPEAAQPIAYDVWESPHALVVLVDLPGVEAQNLALSLGSQALYLEVSVPAGREASPGMATGRYELRVEAPLGSGPDAIDASLSNGLLRIRISKESTGARRVTITSSGND